ncbi:hypothetical protein [uncultured Clostridium sp.]|uniref:hypothetical protein n=1 Tax=uncultured Clostridium sp. TaxID=59620 RepID=UPI002619F0C7|nr:hypothetical protein [uncultured Clostridium sp.]
MKYIGPFFRMNSLSPEEICGQLFHFSKESMKTIVLNSRCGCVSQQKNSKKDSSLDKSGIMQKYSPLLCIYRKASPSFIHSKTSQGFDSSTFRREINPTTNALMTMSVLELADYYSKFKDSSKEKVLQEFFRDVSKEQLDFYYNNLRNNEGIFVTKKNVFSTGNKDAALIDKNRKFIFSDQAYMMVAYYVHSSTTDDVDTKNEFESFSNQILQMFVDYKDALYDLSFDEGCKTLLAFNIYYKHSKNDEILPLIIDLCEFLCSKFSEKDYYIDALDCCALFSINLIYSYEHTNLFTFKEKFDEIMQKLICLYNEDANIIQKLTDKKEIKYSSFDICFYFIALILYTAHTDKKHEHKNMISNIYKKYILNSGLITSWPKPPTLDDTERYRGFTNLSKDMIDETFFSMPNLTTPDETGIAPIILKNITYSLKKDKFDAPKKVFDSNKNMFILFLFMFVLKENFYDELGITEKNSDAENSIEDLKNDSSEYVEAEIVNNPTEVI